MSYPINYPTPQGANIQILYTTEDWVKPQGASFVWFTLIGAGGGAGYTLDTSAGAAGGGGGSASVTNCMVPAFLIPDVLRITIGKGGIGAKTSVISDGTSGGNTILSYQQKATSAYTLLTANGAGGGQGGGLGVSGTGGAAGTATTSNYFTCMGFFQSVAGQVGTIGTTSAPTNTFLTAGGSADIVGNYGYGTPQGAGANGGYFQMQPIIVGYGGQSNMLTTTNARISNGGIGCGGGSSFYGPNAGADGGDGVAVIITW